MDDHLLRQAEGLGLYMEALELLAEGFRLLRRVRSWEIVD
jgi:hypothetical protein